MRLFAAAAVTTCLIACSPEPRVPYSGVSLDRDTDGCAYTVTFDTQGEATLDCDAEGECTCAVGDASETLTDAALCDDLDENFQKSSTAGTVFVADSVATACGL